MKDRKKIALLGILFVIFISIVLFVSYYGIDHKFVFSEKECTDKKLNYIGNTEKQGVYSLCTRSVTLIGIKNKSNIIKKDKLLRGNIKTSKKLERGVTYYRGINYYVVDCGNRGKMIIVGHKHLEDALHMC